LRLAYFSRKNEYDVDCTIVRIYADEAYCNKRTFRIITLIWGSPGYLEELDSAIADVVQNNRGVLGPDFKEFHAHKLTEKNWATLSPAYEAVLAALFERIHLRQFGLQTVILSEDRFKGNAGWLTDAARKKLENRTSNLGRLFQSFGEEDLPAVYYRVNQLFPIFGYREFFAAPGDHLEYFPDSTGKVRNYVNTDFPMSGTLPFSLPLNYLEIIRMFGDAYLKSFGVTAKELGLGKWPTSVQHLVKFQPTDSASFYLIQVCDIVSNFIFSFIRQTCGLPDAKYQLKSTLLQKYIDLEDLVVPLQASFSIDGTDVICTDPNLWANLNPLALE